MIRTTKTALVAAKLIVAAAIILVAFPIGTNAMSPAVAPSAHGPVAAAPAPALDCFPYLLNLSDCLTYVQAGSNLTKPDKGCCPELANLVVVKPVCLCELLGNPDQSPVAIDLHKALGLPAVCKINAPSVSVCSALGVPVAAPAGSIGTLSPEGFASSSPTSPKNGGQSTTASQRHFFVGFAIVLFISFF